MDDNHQEMLGFFRVAIGDEVGGLSLEERSSRIDDGCEGN